MKNEEINQEVTAQANYRVVGSVSVNYDNPVAGYMQSSRLDILTGSAKVTATNTGSNTLVVRVMKIESGQHILKEWNVAPGNSFDSGIFSIPPNT